MKRLFCYLLGCEQNAFDYCPRCCEHVYSGRWIERGKLLPIILFWHRVKGFITAHIVGSKCEVCGKRFHKGASPWACSQECQKHWIPF